MDNPFAAKPERKARAEALLARVDAAIALDTAISSRLRTLRGELTVALKDGTDSYLSWTLGLFRDAIENAISTAEFFAAQRETAA